MSYYTKEEYLGAIFKLKILARSKKPISIGSQFNLGLCSKNILANNGKFKTISQFCPLDLDKTTTDQAYGCLVRCAHFEHNHPVEQIYKLIEDFEVKD